MATASRLQELDPAGVPDPLPKGRAPLKGRYQVLLLFRRRPPPPPPLPHQTTLEAPTKLDAPAQPATADPAILGALASSVEAQAPGLSWGRVALGPGEVESRLVAAGEHALTPWWRDVLDGAGDARVVVVRAGRRGGKTTSAIRWMLRLLTHARRKVCEVSHRTRVAEAWRVVLGWS